MRNIVPNLVLSARGDEVFMSMINGKIVYENGKIQTIDEKELLSFVQQTSNEVNLEASREVRKRRTFQYRLTDEGKY